MYTFCIDYFLLISRGRGRETERRVLSEAQRRLHFQNLTVNNAHCCILTWMAIERRLSKRVRIMPMKAMMYSTTCSTYNQVTNHHARAIDFIFVQLHCSTRQAVYHMSSEDCRHLKRKEKQKEEGTEELEDMTVSLGNMLADTIPQELYRSQSENALIMDKGICRP